MHSSGLRAGLLGVAAVEVADNLLCVLQVVRRHLSRLVVSSPLDSVLQARAASSAAAVQAGVQDFLNFELFYTIDLYQQRRVLLLARKGVISYRAEQANVELQMVFYRGRQIQTVSVQANDSSDLEGSQVLLIKLLLQVECLNIIGIELYLLADIVLVGRLALLVYILFIIGLGYIDLRLQELIDLLYSRYKLLSIPSPRGLVRYYRLEPYIGVEPIISKEQYCLNAFI